MVGVVLWCGSAAPPDVNSIPFFHPLFVRLVRAGRDVGLSISKRTEFDEIRSIGNIRGPWATTTTFIA